MKYPCLSLLCLLITTGALAQLEDGLKLNQVQVIGSHNSYKQSIDPKLFKLISKFDSVGASTIDYSHVTLTEQLNLGLHDLEIDVYSDTLGGRYAHPKGLSWAPGQASYDTTVMLQPGFKVLHVQDIDFRSNCATFKLCLQELKRWSDANPGHLPIFITMNFKDDALSKTEVAQNFTAPETFTSHTFDLVDKEITDYLGRQKVITPDDVRGNYHTLEEAVLAGNWPTIKKAAGKFIFVVDETDAKIPMYAQNHPSLKGRILFENAEPGTPEAAILIRNNPKQDNINALVKKGYMVRTRADADTKEARENDYSSFEAACNSGAQIITTDYYKKSTHFTSDYVVSFDSKTYVRKNTVATGTDDKTSPEKSGQAVVTQAK